MKLFSAQRGYLDHGWLRTYHSFSFGEYYNPEYIHFGALRVLNEDWIAPGKGFGTHPHDNMEIVTIPLSGVLEHEDSMGYHKQLRSGEVQVMSAGTGIRHSEYNASTKEELHLLQIWVFPKKRELTPRYMQKDFSAAFTKMNQWITVVHPKGEQGALILGQEAYFSLGRWGNEKKVSYRAHEKGNGLWVMILEGAVVYEGETYAVGDAFSSTKSDMELSMIEQGRVLVIEVPMHLASW